MRALPHDFPTLLDAFVHRVHERPEAVAFVFVDDAGEHETPITCGELDLRARRIAATLIAAGAPGQPVMLLYTPGLDYISALLGCLYAGSIAVPAYPPLHPRQVPRIQALIDDARAPVVLTHASWFDPAFVPPASDASGLSTTWIHTGRAPHAHVDPWMGTPGWQPDDIVVLQYTSGSTGQPKGVMLSAGNLTHNVRHMADRMGCREGLSGVTWLPPYHDMGLIAGILMPLYTGLTGVVMSPASFAQRPVRWLQAMSRHQGVISGGPNAAYELTLDKVSDAQLAGLDLSAWRIAVNGAEPVRASTLHRFATRFGEVGYRPSTFYPAYGLAEATLLVTGAPWPGTPDPQADPAQDPAHPVPLGHSLHDQQVRIVDPHTCTPCALGDEGEIWVSGPSVAQGYWRQPELSAATFQATLHSPVPDDAPPRHWLRTGDLGRWVEGQLQVTGRMKDQINLAGRKLYPQDIELCAQRAHEALRKHASAAFAVPGALRDQLVLVQELEPRARADATAVLDAMRLALARELDVQPDDIVLVKAGSVDKTSSGKVRRSSCRQAYLDGHIEVVARSQRPADAPPPTPGPFGLAPGLAADPNHARTPRPHDAASLLSALQQHVARSLAVSPLQIDPTLNLAQLGMDSLALGRLQAVLDGWHLPELPLQRLFHAPLMDLAVELAATLAIPTPTVASPAPTTAPAEASDPAQAFPLTPLQQAYVLGRDDGAAQVFAQLDITGLDLPRLQQTWVMLCRRHPMLHMRLADWPMQRLHHPDEAQILQAWTVHDWRSKGQAAAAVQHQAWADVLARQALPPDGTLHALHVMHLPDGRTHLMVVIDMLVADATSLRTLMADWARLFAGQALPPLTLRVDQALRALPALVAARGHAGWQARLLDLPAAPALPLAALPAHTQAPAVPGLWRRRSLTLAAAPWQALRQLARHLQVTPAMLLLRAYAEVVGLFAREPRFTLMLTLFNRPAVHPQIDQVVGDFTAVLPLALDVRGDDFAAAVQRTQADFLSALALSDGDGLDVQREHRRLHGTGPLPLSAFVFTCLLHEPADAPALGTVQAVLTRTPQVWLDHQITVHHGQLHIDWDAREQAFPPGLLDAMFEAWRRLLHQLAATDAASPWTALRPHGPRADGRSALLDAGLTPSLQPGEPSRPAPREALHQPFLRQVARQPHATALRTAARSFSYAQLEAHSAQVARTLRQRGATPGTLVGIFMRKGWQQVLAVLGISRSGAAYLPIDPDLPAARVARLLTLGQVRTVLVAADAPDDALAALPPLPGLPPLDIIPIGERPQAAQDLQATPLPHVAPDDLAYVIFTSGSTGEPKGVAMAHAAVLNTVVDINARTQLGEPGQPRDVVLALSALNFDLSVWDVFGTLAAGASIAMPDPALRHDIAALLAFACHQEVTVINAVPALVQLMAEHAETQAWSWPATVRWVLMSGDWIPVHLPDRLRALRPGIEQLALGGATEAAIWSNSHTIGSSGMHWPGMAALPSIPYGRALTHQQMVVLDHAGHPRPTWVAGEIHIGGVGLAQGYWRDAATTAARFITHPHTGQRLYRTGDLGRHLPDGQIEFLGRIDQQLKLAGHRIEPGEIEHTARQVPGVRDALVLVCRPSGPDHAAPARLVAFALTDAEAPTASPDALIGALTTHLRQHLPAPLQPALWLVRDHWPLSANGKVDRAALLADAQAALQAATHHATPIGDAAPDAAHTYPAGSMTARVHDVLCTTWGLSHLPLHASFLDLGLNSIDLMRAVNALGAALGVRPAIHQLFDGPTLAQVASLCTPLQPPTTAADRPPPTAAQPRAPQPRVDTPWAPLTPGQRSLWLLEQLHPQAAAYNETLALHLRGALNLGALHAALHDLVQRHDSLRLCFGWQDGEPMQQARPPDDAAPLWDEQHLHTPDLHDHSALQALLQPWAHRPFDLAHGPLLRVALVSPPDAVAPGTATEHVLAIGTHHLVSDGWSLAVLQRELAWLYAVHAGLPGATAQTLPPLPHSFTAWAWQVHEAAQQPAHQAARAASLAHWRSLLATPDQPLPVLAWPTDRARPAQPGFDARTHEVTLPADTLAALQRLAQARHTTLHAVLMAAYALLLSRHTGQSDLCIGTPVARRDRPELEPLIGYLVDTPALRCRLHPAQPLSQLIDDVHQQMQAARQHDALSFSDIVEALQPERHPGRTPVFQTLFALQNTPPARIDLAGLQVRPLALGLERAKFDLVLEVMDGTGQARFTAAASLCDDAGLAALARQYRQLLQHLQQQLNPSPDARQVPLQHLSLLDANDRHRLLHDWSGADAAQAFVQQHPASGRHAPQATLLATLQHHARHRADALALRFEDEPGLSHAQLDALSTIAAQRLVQHGVRPGQLVGLHLPRSTELFVSLLAIWKAGAAYLPLDPGYPVDRLSLMADDAQLPWVVTADAATAPPPWPAATQRIDGAALCLPPTDTAPGDPLPTVTGDDLAYVIYTSGSTGRPKGTPIRHRNAWHLGLAAAQHMGLQRPVRMLQLASMSFDATVLELALAWTHGGSLHLIGPDTLMAPPRLLDVMRRQAVEAALMPPSLAAVLCPATGPHTLATLPALHTLLVGGERCPADLPARLPHHLRLINAYGPTEATVCATALVCAPPAASPADAPPPAIGRPLPGTTVCVLDAHGLLCPPGVPGELHIGGTGLSDGYLHRPELSAERFVPHPFVPGQRLYRTGDQVRWGHDGLLHYLGRLDQQIKLRGMRVEPGELEAALAGLGGVAEAVVTTALLHGEPQLVAHIVPTPDAPPTDAHWRDALARRLPAHMLPATFMRHTALPRLPNGKTDRQALPVPDAATATPAPFMGPRDTLELGVLQLWEEVLERQGFGILDHFFDVGGHSIKAMRLLGRVQQVFGVELPVAALLRQPTVEGMAALLRQQAAPSTSSLVPIQPQGSRPPIFFVHAAGGTVMCYHELARHMSPDQPVYGLQAQGIEAGTEPAPDLPAMARHYVQAMRSVQPHGPYRIAGWSMGGNIVFEMAHQLQRQGEQVALLGLLDASAAAFDNPTPVRDNAAILAEMFANEFDVSAELMRQLPQDDLIEHAVAMAESHQWLPPGFTVAAAHRILRVYRTSEASIKQHRPQKLACTATLYRTHEVIEGEDDEPEDRGWTPWVAHLRIHPVPGNHINMVMAPHSRTLAAAIDRDLQALLPTPTA